MNVRQKSAFRFVLHVAALFVVLVVCGLVTRAFALRLPRFYAVHAVLVAPLYAALFASYLERFHKALPFALAACLYGALLGLMHPVMTVSILMPLALALLIRDILPGSSRDFISRVSGLVLGATCYPATIAASVVLSGGSALNLYPAQVVVMMTLGSAFAFLGALAGHRIAYRFLQHRKDHIWA